MANIYIYIHTYISERLSGFRVSRTTLLPLKPSNHGSEADSGPTGADSCS